ncbi:hypothetical protein PFISCL1PPCAC_13084, partial [Pristionchus fissidentatus]
ELVIEGLGMDSSSPIADPSRVCLVCGAPTTSIHFGVDACRACTVFYRKARKRKLAVCRSNSRRCSMTQDGAIACKRCRFERFDRIIHQSEAASKPQRDRPVVLPSPGTSGATQPSKDVNATLLPSPIRIPAIVPLATTASRPLLDHCKMGYRFMNSMRRNCELNARREFPQISDMIEPEFDILPATFGQLNASTRYIMSGVFDFAESLFPEFAAFSKKEKWALAVGFHNRFFSFDGSYRSEAVYPDDMNKSMAGMTCFISTEIADGFFADCPNDGSNVQAAKRILQEFIVRMIPPLRKAVHRIQLDTDEFHAMLILIFWFADSLQISDEIAQVGEKYRQAVLRELQAHYRDDLHLEDYAARIGELFMLVFHFERSTDLQEHFEIYRLLGIFTDDTFVYRLQQRGQI